MPLVNYCKKCKAETPVGDSCPYCGGKLSQTGEQISFGTIHLPQKDWFAWNQLLRIILPVVLLVLVVVITAEGTASGTQGVIALLTGGFLRAMIVLMLVAAAGIWLMFKMQGAENVHVVLDKQGVWIRTYVQQDNEMALYARFLNAQTVEKLAQEDDRPELEGLTLVKKTFLSWNDVARVHIWREDSAILFYRPSFWQAAAVRVPVNELETAEEYVRKKLKRNKKARIQPRK